MSSSFQVLNCKVYSTPNKPKKQRRSGPKVKVKNRIVRELVNINDEQCLEILDIIKKFKEDKSIPEYDKINPADFVVKCNSGRGRPRNIAFEY